MKSKILLMAALTCAVVANAANPKGEKIDTARTYQLQDVQVTSIRANEKTPMTFKNLDQKAIRQVNFGQDIPYVLSLTPSITVTSDAGNGIGYTSFRVRGTDPSRINITSNGIPMNDAESSQVYWVNIGDFASSVKNMQIQRGVGSSTNGAGAFGATLNMQTEDLGAKPFLGLDLSAGSYYSHKETLRFGTGLLNGHWAVQGRLSNIGSKGYLRRASTDLNNYFLQGGYFSDNTMVKFVTFNGTEKTYHAWNYASKYEQSLYGRRYNSCGEYYDANGNTKYYKDQTDNYHQQHYQLFLNQILNEQLNLNVALHYTKGNGYYEEYKGDKYWAGYGLTANENILGNLVRRKQMDNDFYGAIANINYDNKKGITASLGGGWNKYIGRHFGNVIWAGDAYTKDDNENKTYQTSSFNLEPNFEYYRNKAKKTDGNIYGKLNWEFIEGLSAYIDMQYRHINITMQNPEDSYTGTYGGAYIIDDNFNFFNPKFGLNYSFLKNHRLYVSYAISHKEPTRNNYEETLGKGLKSERLNDLELGYQYHSRNFSAGANFYYMDYKNQFVLTGELNNIGEAITKNLANSYRMGIELEAAWQPAEWFHWNANATFSDNKVKDMTVTLKDGTSANIGDQKLAFSPDVIANNIFSFIYKGFTGSIQTQYVGEQYLTNTGFKSYTTTDDNGNPIEVGMTLKNHISTNIDLAYNFSLKKWGIKDATIGFTMYNIFSKEFDNNGWAAPSYKKDSNGNVIAYTSGDQYEAGFAPSAPFNCMAHLSINF